MCLRICLLTTFINTHLNHTTLAMQMKQINQGRPGKKEDRPVSWIICRIVPGNMTKAAATHTLPVISKAEKIIHGM
jgi:hypothetical protein